MSNLESSKEKLHSSRKRLLETENDLTHLESDTRLSSLKSEIWVWIIKYENISKDWKYKVFSYTPNMPSFPFGIKQYAKNYLNTGNIEWIKITKQNWEEYNDFHLLSAWEKIYIKIPKDTEVQWIPIYENDSKDWEYQVFSYINRFWNFATTIKEETARLLGLANSQWIKITDKEWNEFGSFHYFGPWEKLYIKVPKKETTTWIHNNEYLYDIDSENENGTHWDNKDYFDNSKKVETDNTYKNKWIILKRDVWMTFYVMNTKDIQYKKEKNKNGKITKHASRVDTINYLRKKLWALPEFSYLNNPEYAPWKDGVTQTFNIRPDFAQYLKNYPNSYFIPIPMDSKERKVEDKTFKNYAKSWIDKICQKDEPYGKYWKWIWDKSKLAAFFTAIAKVETWRTIKKIWTDEYHRRETNWHNCFSFGPHHILMEWPWKRAFNKLKTAWYFSTEWQTYHPKNATMRCMWFIVEKLKDLKVKDTEIPKKISNILSFFNKRNVTWDDFRNFAKIYNGSGYAKNDYHNKFAQAYNIVK